MNRTSLYLFTWFFLRQLVRSNGEIEVADDLYRHLIQNGELADTGLLHSDSSFGEYEFLDQKLEEEFKQVVKLTLQGGPDRWYITGNRNAEGQVIRPLAIRSGTYYKSPLCNHSNSVSIIAAGDSPSTEGKTSLFNSFSVVDFSGCTPDAGFYDILPRISSSGTVILPVCGVDLREINNLPRRMKHLVLFHTRISNRFSSLVEDCSSLSKISFIGCYHDSSIEYKNLKSGNSTDSIILGSIANQIEELVCVNGSNSLSNALVMHDWPKLKSLSVSNTAPFRVSKFRRGLGAQKELNYPSLKNVTIYTCVKDHDSTEELTRFIAAQNDFASTMFGAKGGTNLRNVLFGK